jgi:hypothetical protein
MQIEWRNIAAIAMASLLVAAVSRDQLSRRTYAQVRRMIEIYAPSAPPGESIPLVAPGINGELRLRSQMSHSNPGEDCGACEDPCRSFTFFVTDANGSGSFYGDVCRDVDSGRWSVSHTGMESWTPALPAAREKPRRVVVQQIIRVVPSSPPPAPAAPVPQAPAKPPIDPELSRTILNNLVSLRYLRADKTSDSDEVKAAEAAFAADDKTGLPPDAATWLEFNTALTKAVERGRQADCDLPQAVRRSFSMCASLTQR